MPRIAHISLYQFKNHSTAQWDFTQKVVAICGANGMGKTNLLDAIYYLCFTKSYFAASDSMVQQQGQKGLRLAGTITDENQGKTEVVAVLRETGRKEFSVNGEIYPRLAAHVGRFPAVMIAPDDIQIITGGSEERRRLMDVLMCQLNADYLQHLMEYNKLLQQRNSLLRQMAETHARDFALLEILDEQLATRGSFIWQERQRVMAHYLPAAEHHYRLISGGAEQVSFTYQSGLQAFGKEASKAAFVEMLSAQRKKDLVLQRTSAGIHRDDLQLLIEGQPFRQIASQGQRKSLLFALKLTEFEWLQEHKGFAPFLLLDDVFEKLDNDRMQNLLKEVCVQKDGQVFITDTHYQRLQEQLDAIGAAYEIITL